MCLLELDNGNGWAAPLDSCREDHSLKDHYTLAYTHNVVYTLVVMEMGVHQYHVVTGNSSWLYCVHLNRCNDLLEIRDKNDHKLEARG